MSEITITLTEDEARALVPWVGRDHDADEWNRRQDRAEDAISKIRAALREQVPAPSKDQTSIEGLAA